MRNSTRRVVKAYLSELPGADIASLSLQAVLAAMRGMSWHYQTAHWQVGGPPGYGDHLLFSRFYEGLVPEIDGMAEKLVGYYGTNAVDAWNSFSITHAFLLRFAGIDCLFERSLKMEETFQRALRDAYNGIKGETEVMTLGLDDFLMATASAHEANTYLLQQRLYGQCLAPAAGRVASEHISLTNLERSEGGYSTFRPRRHAEEGEEECSCGCGKTARVDLDRKVRKKANQALSLVGLDGDRRFETPDRGYAAALDTLSDFGLQLDKAASSPSFNRPRGSIAVDLATSNARLVATWREIRPRYYEVLAHVS